MRDLFLDAQHNLRDRWQSAHANADMIMRCDIEKGIVGIAKMSNFMAGFGMIAAAGVVEVKCRRSEVEHFVTRPCRDSPLIIIGINSFVLRQDHGNFFYESLGHDSTSNSASCAISCFWQTFCRNFYA